MTRASKPVNGGLLIPGRPALMTSITLPASRLRARSLPHIPHGMRPLRGALRVGAPP